MKPPHEFKVMCVRECQPEPAMIDTPARTVEYWYANIPTRWRANIKRLPNRILTKRPDPSEAVQARPKA